MKLITVVHKLPFCITVDKEKDQAVKYEASKPLMERISHRSSPLKISKMALSSNTHKAFHCFQKPIHSSILNDIKLLNNKIDILYLGIPDLYNKEVSELLNDQNKSAAVDYFRSKNCEPVFLDFENFSGGYDDYPKNKLMNVFFSKFWDDIFKNFNEKKAFDDYKKMNETYCDVIMNCYEDGDLIWIVDHELWLLPKMLKKIKPDLTIGMSVFVPFPTPAMLKKVPSAKKILKSMMASNMIVWENENQMNNFVDCCFDILNLTNTLKTIYQSDKKRNILSEITNFNLKPEKNKKQFKYGETLMMIEKIGIEYKIDKCILGRQDCNNIYNTYLEKYKSKNVIVSVSNSSDYSMLKDTLMAIEGYLYKYGNNIVFLNLEIPDRPAEKEIEMEISRMKMFIMNNYNVTELESIKSVDDDLYFALLRFADLGIILSDKCVISRPILDFIVAQEDKCAPLIVSETIKCCENFNLVKVNSKEPESFSDQIYKSLVAPKIPKRYKKSLEWIKNNSTTQYVSSIFQNLKQIRYSLDLDISISSELNVDKMLDRYEESEKCLFLLDYDGTICEICDNPIDARPTDEILKILDKLANNDKNIVCLVTGRSKEDADKWFKNEKIKIYAEHGSVKRENGSWSEIYYDLSWKPQAESIIHNFHERTPGSSVENKSTSIAFHYRNCDPIIKSTQAQLCRNALKNLIENVDILQGKDVIEVRIKGINKGEIAKKYEKYGFILSAGDDITDESMFEALKEKMNSYTFYIGEKDSNTSAKYAISDPKKFREFLGLFS
ncbi:putative trehalose-phosphatase [Dictyocoela muelleri]|nr:putative trehalose-phosphatase [Dictyocoela muelleri]